jgi:hypothetical protein
MSSPYDPEPMEVVAPDGTPKAVKYKMRFVQVKEILNIWRVDDEWWRKPISRMYYAVESANGSRLTVFHDLIADKWYRQNWVDSSDVGLR